MSKLFVNAEKAFELMYELFKAKPWISTVGAMTDEDHAFEGEGLLFLMTLKEADDWGTCSKPAQRIAASLLIDFTARLRGPLYHAEWRVPADLPPWAQAAQIVQDEICRSHPHLSELH